LTHEQDNEERSSSPAGEAGSGPFVDIDTARETLAAPPSVITTTPASEFDSADANRATPLEPFPLHWEHPDALFLYTNGAARTAYDFPIDGTYRFTVSAMGVEAGPDLPGLRVYVGSLESSEVAVPGETFSDHSWELEVPLADSRSLRHRAGAPVRSSSRRRFQGLDDHLLDFVVAALAGSPRPRLVL
jgi:hypothetical protein